MNERGHSHWLWSVAHGLGAACLFAVAAGVFASLPARAVDHPLAVADVSGQPEASIGAPRFPAVAPLLDRQGAP